LNGSCAFKNQEVFEYFHVYQTPWSIYFFYFNNCILFAILVSVSFLLNVNYDYRTVEKVLYPQNSWIILIIRDALDKSIFETTKIKIEYQMVLIS